MAAPYVPNTAYLFWENTCNGDSVGFGYYATFLAGPYDQADIDNLADVGDDWYSANMAPLQSVSCGYNGCRVRGVNAIIDLEAFDFSGATPGGSANAPLPNNVTIAISFRTGFSGRSRRGRQYHIGLVESDVTNNAVGVLIAAELLAAYGGFFGDLQTAASCEHVIVSYCNNNAWRSSALITEVSSYVLTDTNVDTQRKRLPA